MADQWLCQYTDTCTEICEYRKESSQWNNKKKAGPVEFRRCLHKNNEREAQYQTL